MSEEPSRFRVKAAATLVALLVLGGLALAYGRGLFTRRADVRDVGAFSAGTRTVQANDLVFEIWYPAPPSSPEALVRYEQAHVGYVARNAPVAEAPPRPLVVLSHGYTASRFELAWLAERLAAGGVVAIAVDHADAGRAMDGALACERAKKVHAAVDAALADPTIRARVAGDRVVAVGHSFGGTTALALAGARVRGHAGCDDARVRGVVATAPPLEPFEPAAAPATPSPVIFAGTADSLVASADTVAARWPGVRVVRVPGAGHFVFKGVCTPYATARMPVVCKDAAGVRRRAVHDDVAAAVLALLE